MKKHISNYIIKVNDILSDPGSEIVGIDQDIPVWKIEGLADFTIDSSVHISAQLQKIERGEILGVFKINYQIKGICFKCLADKTEKISIETKVVFSIYENTEDDKIKISKYGEINLQNFIEQEIVTHLPQDFKCKLSCKGLCGVCGNNNNIKKCKCRKV